MSISALQDYIFATKYARYREDLQRRETYEEAMDRVVGMHAEKYSGCDISDELEFVRRALHDKLVLGSQRALQFGGHPIFEKEARIYNCTTSYVDRPRFFQECLWLLLCGCGAGFSVQTHHIAQLPDIRPRTKGTRTYIIPDTIEGWADSLGVLLASYGLVDDEMQEFDATEPDMQLGGTFHDFVGHPVEFDYSWIRPKGAPLRSSSGKAPGPDALRRSLELIDGMLRDRVEAGHSRLRPIDAYDIMMHAADAVLSGGVRRSASICLFSPDDEEMLRAKTGAWYTENPQRARSNNSAVLIRDETSYEQFHGFIDSVRQFGEPGFVWADDRDITYNPCVEIGLYPQIDGKSGWAFCNLCEINAKDCKTEEDWDRACIAAAYLGTFQAGYTNFPYLGETSSRIAQREALLGCSMTGMADNPDMAFDPEGQRRRAQLILDTNAKVAAKIGINPTARATCVKPAGTTSCILGTASGIHPHHADMYTRRVQANEQEETLKFFQQHNPRAVEHSVWNPNGTDRSVIFCIDVPKSLTKQDVSAIDLLAKVKSTQDNWVMGGTVKERCARPWLRHNVSNTINVRDNEWEKVARFIYDNRDSFAGISLLSHSGDLDYPQAPMCAIKSSEQLIKDYGDAVFMASGLIVDGLHAFGENLWEACNCVLGIGEDLELFTLDPSSPERVKDAWRKCHGLKVDWVRRAEQFAVRYFGYRPKAITRIKNQLKKHPGDALLEAELLEKQEPLRRMTHCLKDVNNRKLWVDLKREYKNIDYSQMIEKEDNTKSVTLDAACAGGNCDVIAG